MDYILLETVQSMKLFLRQYLKLHLKSVEIVAFSEKKLPESHHSTAARYFVCNVTVSLLHPTSKTTQRQKLCFKSELYILQLNIESFYYYHLTVVCVLFVSFRRKKFKCWFKSSIKTPKSKPKRKYSHNKYDKIIFFFFFFFFSRQVCKEQFNCLWMDICLYLSHPRAYCLASSCCSKRTQTPRYSATSVCLVETSETALDIFSYIRHPYFCA